MDVLEQTLGHARRAPDRLAVKDASNSLTYGDLAARIATIAAGLRAYGIAPGDRIAILLPTCVDALVVALGCMWRGVVWVPLSPSDPPARVEAVLTDCAPSLIVVEHSARGRGRAAHHDVRCVDTEDLVSAGTEVEPPERASSGPTYCVYTSGTTGTPKGVLVGRAALGAAVEDTISICGLGPATRAMCISAFHFDGSFATLFCVPAAGGTLVLLRREPMVLPRIFVAAVLDNSIDLTMCSPSFLRLLLASPAIERLAGSSLRTIGFGGSAATPSTILALAQRLPGVRMFNRYGPTETVIAVATHEVTPEDVSARGYVSIGRPHPGVIFHLLDSSGGAVTTTDEVGELYVGGDQLMDGYLGDVELSASMLRRDIVPGQLLYRTGDLVRRDVHGDFVYVGRADRVVKRHGVRISLDEIETALRDHPGVAEAAVLTYSDGDEIRIVGYAVASPETTPSDLAAAVRARVPSSMVPDALRIVEEMPLTAACKVDYATLRRSYAA